MKLTHEQLNRAICEIRGVCWHPSYHNEYNGSGREHICDVCKVNLRELDTLLYFLEDANAMLELLDEFNNQNPHEDGDYPVITGCGVQGWRCDLMWSSDDGEAEQFWVLGKTPMEAVSLCWHRWKTGEVVELEGIQ